MSSEQTRTRHRLQIIDILRCKSCLTKELARITHRFSARVMELRQQGYEITATRWGKGDFLYQLTGEPGEPGDAKQYVRNAMYLIFSGTNEYHGGAQDIALEMRCKLPEAIARAKLELTDHGKTWVHVYSPAHGIVYDSEEE